MYSFGYMLNCVVTLLPTTGLFLWIMANLAQSFQFVRPTFAQMQYIIGLAGSFTGEWPSDVS